MFSRKKPMKSDLQLNRLSRLLDKLQESKVDLPTDGIEAVICDDGVVIFSISEKYSEIMMVKNIRKVNFSINLTEEEMQEFNGGKGLRVRFIRHRW